MAQGQITTDGTVGPAAQAIEAVGGAYTIEEALGQRAGNNLFHSFDQFNVNTGESATFTGDSNIQNVISRVTGGSASNIDGLLRSTIGTADLYFLNPAGVLFGPNATLDLPGAFHVSTADSIELGDGELFYANPMESSVLSTAAPTAFGFLDVPEGDITVDGSELSVGEGKTLSLVGGPIGVKNGARLNTEAGQVNLVSVASVGDAAFVSEDGDLDSSAFSTLGEISIKGDSSLSVDGNGGGRILIRGGQIVVEDSDLLAQTQGDGNGAGIDIAATGRFDFVRSLIDTRTSGSGRAGDISILADVIRFDASNALREVGIFSGSRTAGEMFSLLLDLSHFFPGDLVGTLISPSETEVILFDEVPGFFGGFNDIRLSDDALVSIADEEAYLYQEFQPEEPFSTFAVENLEGEWTLRVVDNYGFDVVNLNNWSLEINGQTYNSVDVPKESETFGEAKIESVLDVANIPTVGSEEGTAGNINIQANRLNVFADSRDARLNASSGVQLGTIAVDVADIQLNDQPGLLLETSPGVSEFFAVSNGHLDFDGSLGLAFAPNGSSYQIDAQYGQTKGVNLFHSFGYFNLAEGETAIFSGPDGISNIISRVTAGDVSDIFGTIRSDIEGADMYFLNPAGFLFGEDASLDTTGAFHVSTADYLTLDDGEGWFDTSLSGDSNLTTASPGSFGFLADAAFGTIELRSASLEAPEGSVVNFVGGDITMADFIFLESAGGQINLTSVQSAGEAERVFTDGNEDIDAGGFTQMGRISLSNFVRLNVNGDGGGRIRVHGDEVIFDETSLSAQTQADGNAGRGIEIIADGSFDFVSSLIDTRAVDEGNGGDITIRADAVLYDTSVDFGKAGIFSSSVISLFEDEPTSGKGRAGAISITTNSLSTFDSAGSNAPIEAVSANQPGTISVDVPNIEISGQPGIALVTSPGVLEFVTPGNEHLSFDGSLGLAFAPNGPDYRIDARFGQIKGVNLFHSFSYFNLAEGETAIFSGSDSIATIISRITAGDVSDIFGTIQSDVEGADMYFLNPAGFLFGKDASLDVTGSFYVSTADYLTLNDVDGRFDTSVSGSDNLTSAAPEAFGFSDDASFGIIELSGASLEAAEASVLSFVSGDITATDGALLKSTGGQINLISVQSDGEAERVASGENETIDASGFSQMGAIFLSDSSALNADGDRGGRISVQGNELVFEDAVLSAQTLAEGNTGRGIKIVAETSLKFIRSLIDTRSIGKGTAGDININAPSFLYDIRNAANAAGILSSGVALSSQSDFSVLLDITHTNVGDLVAKLISPKGTEVLLFSVVGEFSEDLKNIRLNDAALTSINNYPAATDVYSPAQPLSTFADDNFEGDWTLQIEDIFPVISGGSLNSWGLEINGQSFSLIGLSESINVNGFSDAFVTSTLTVSDITPFVPEVSIGVAGNINIVTDQLDVFFDGIDSGISATAESPDAIGTVNIVANKINYYEFPARFIPDDNGSGRFIVSGSISYDGSLGDAGTVDKIDDDYFIESGFGQTRGGNLFHSFNNFILSDSETATFMIDENIDRIISRVTGDNGAFIDGLVQSNVSGVHLFFLSPNGIFIGPSGSIDLNSSFNEFTASTADFIRLSDVGNGRGYFSAADPNNETLNILTAGTPDTFGFLLDTVKDINILSGDFVVDESKTITLIGGDLNLSQVSTSGQRGIFLPFGQVNLIAVNSEGEAIFDETGGIQTDSFAAFGNINLSQFDVDVNGELGGGLFVRGENLTLQNNSALLSEVLGDNPELSSKTVTIDVEGDIGILNGAFISVGTLGSGDGGKASIFAENLTIDRQDNPIFTGIASRASESSIGGNGGELDIVVSEHLQILGGGEISVSTLSTGNGGQANITAKNLTIDRKESDNFTGIDSQARESSNGGNGGRLDIEVTEHLQILNGGEVSVSTFSDGNGGRAEITAKNLTIDGQFNDDFTGITSQADGLSTGGNGGELDVKVAEHLQILRGGEISVSTFSSGNGGQAVILAKDLTLSSGGEISSEANSVSSGDGGQLEIEVSGHLQVLAGGKISLTTVGQGNGGKAAIRAGDLSLLNGGVINSEANNFVSNGGDGGELDVTVANLFQVVNGSRLSASSLSSGNGGKVTLRAKNLLVSSQSSELTFVGAASTGSGNGGELNFVVEEAVQIVNGGQVSVSSTSSGNGGDLNIHADVIEIKGSDVDNFSSGIFASALGSGNGGNLTINAREVSVKDRGTIRASVFRSNSEVPEGTGNAGDLTFNVTESLLIDGASNVEGTTAISSNGAFGDAGVIAINMPMGDLILSNGGQIASFTAGSGQGGSVVIDAKSITIVGENDSNASEITTFSRDTEDAGDAGIITLNVAESLSVSDEGTISTSTEGTGDAGDISITAANVLLDGTNANVSSSSNSENADSGKAGSITISTGEMLVLSDGGRINTSTSGGGNAGDISISSDTVRLSGTVGIQFGGVDLAETVIASSTQGDIVEAGDAGQITIKANDLILEDQALIATASFGNGAGKNINLEVADSLSMSADSDFAGIRGIIASSFDVGSDSGKAGAITIASERVDISNHVIATTSFGAGDAGSIKMNGTDLILRNGAEILSSSQNTTLSVDTVGDAGIIEVTTDGSVRLTEGSLISTSSKLSNAGSIKLSAGGNVDISSSEISINAGQGVFQGTLLENERFVLNDPDVEELSDFLTGSTSSEGFVFPNLEIISGRNIRVNESTIDAAAGLLAGIVDLKAAGEIVVSNSSFTLEVDQRGMNLASVWEMFRDETIDVVDGDAFSEAFPELFSTLTLEAENAIRISNSQLITNAGITARDLENLASDVINGFGGSINLKVPLEYPTDVYLFDSTLEARSYAMGGNVIIDPYYYAVSNSDVITSANFIGGDYIINAAYFLQSLDSVVDLSGQQSGSFISSAVDVDLGSELMNLKTDFLNPESFVQVSCDLYYIKERSSFIVEPAKVQLPDFGDYLPSRLPDYLNGSEFTPSTPDVEVMNGGSLPRPDDNCIDCI